MTDSTPAFGLTLPAPGKKGDWGAALNANFTAVDRILAALSRKTLDFHVDPKSTTAPDTYHLLGFRGAVAAGLGVSTAGTTTISSGYGQAQLMLDVTGGADTDGEILISGASRLPGTGGLREPDTEIIPVDGVKTYLSKKTWRHTGTSHPLTLDSSAATDDVDLSLDASLLSVFDNTGHPFVLRRIDLLAESVAEGGFTVVAEKVSVSGYEVTFEELTLGRLDLTESPAEAGHYHDFLVLEEQINPCEGEGLLLSLTLDDPADWKAVRVLVGLEEDPVLPS